jgi:hypothetical protein
MADDPTILSRRHFLVGSAAVSLTSVLAGHREQIGHLLSELGGPDSSPIRATETSVELPSFTFSVEREADLVLLDFEFYNFKKVVEVSFLGVSHKESTHTMLVPESSSNVIVVHFPPQAIAEAAFQYESENPPWYVDPPPVLSAVSGPSRLCFTLPTNGSVSFATMTAADLLDWSGWNLLVPAPSQVPGNGERASFRDGQTIPVPFDPIGGMASYIEYPYGLFLAPTVATNSSADGFTTSFATRTAPLTSTENIADLWTAALVQTNKSDGSARTAQAAAVWAREYDEPKYTNPTEETFIDYGPA